VFRLLDKVTDSDIPVFIHGESGTGKELVARAIHFNGPRARRNFVSENCAAIHETLLESELFGSVRGAFTGANRDRKGLFEVADQGTLFLDEIGEMSPLMQKKLLRVLQEGEFRRVGGKEVIKVDVRILSASNQNIARLVESGEFRADLYYRINVLTVDLPPLRERKEDIPLLAQHFLAVQAEKRKIPIRKMEKSTLQILMGYSWPGNVRELENEIARAIALSDDQITPEVLSTHIQKGQGDSIDLTEIVGRGLKEIVQDQTRILERRVIECTLTATGGVKSEAARRLQISRPTLDSKIERLSIKLPR
jgi:transcriptional regulator with PAS, ATPase and Fis domain